MSSRAVNLTLLVVLAVALLSGVGSFLVGSPDGRWVFWLHRAAPFALACLLGWKWRVVVRGYRKRGVTPATVLAGLFGLLLLGSLASGLLWATVGLRGWRAPLLGQLTGLGIHITLSLLLVPLLLWHALARWPRARRVDLAGRRAVLRYVALGTAGAALWLATEGATRAAGLSGARRRFTGSRERGSLRGNRFPTTNWLTDPIPRIDQTAWRLRVSGAVERELVLRYDELLASPAVTRRAVLDCTGGWYSEQDWTGVALAELLRRAGVRGGRSVLVRSETGYSRRFALDDASRLLLATHVGGEPLSHGHGFPARLVVPGERGFTWVKWVVELEVSERPAWWQLPVPGR